MNVHQYVHTYVCQIINIYIHMYAKKYVHMYINKHVHMHVNIHIQNTPFRTPYRIQTPYQYTHAKHTFSQAMR